MIVREDDFLLPRTSFREDESGDHLRHHGRKGGETHHFGMKLSMGVTCLVLLVFNLFSFPFCTCINEHVNGGTAASIVSLLSSSATIKLPNIVTFAEATPKRRGGGRGVAVGASPAPFAVPPYSLSSACADEIKKWCLYRTPFTQDAINCFESHRSELSHDCLKWHDARLSCQSQIHERAAAGNAEEEGERGGNDGHRDGNAGGVGVGGLGESYRWNDGAKVAAKPNQLAAKRTCDDICKKFCGEGKSLMLCMRVMGKSLRNVVDESCYNSEFAKSIVRSLNSKIN